MAARFRLIDRASTAARLSVVEARTIPLRVPLALTVAAFGFAAIAAIQEVPELRRHGPTLLSSAGRALAELGALALPAAWLLFRGSAAKGWLGRCSRWPWLTVLGSWWGCLLASAASVVGIAAGFALASLVWRHSGGELVATVSALASLPALAAMAQPIAALGLRPAPSAVAWLALAAITLGLGFPVSVPSSATHSAVDSSVGQALPWVVLAHTLVVAGSLLAARVLAHGATRS